MSELAENPHAQVAQIDPVKAVVAQVRSDAFREQIADALPETVPVDKFVRVAITALREQPALANTEPNSLFASIVKCAQDGLYPDGREAALVIFGSKVTYMPMVGGLRKLAAEHGWSIRTAVVYEHDEFEFELGFDARLVHRPPRPGLDRGQPIAAYAAALHRDGRKEFEVMDAAAIEKVRQVSRAKDRGPWVDWWERMWEKTPLRRLFAKLPLDPADRERIERVLTADLEPGDAAALLYGPQARKALASAPDVVVEPEHHDGPVEPESAVSGPGTDGGDQQAGPGSQLSPAAGPVPGPDDDEPEPSLADDPEFTAPEGAVDDIARQAVAAGEAVVPNGENKGLTIRQIAERGSKGEDWLYYTLRRRARDSFRSAVETYVRVMLPDLWARYETWAAKQQEGQS